MNDLPAELFSDDYQPLGVSARHAAADQLAALVAEMGLATMPCDGQAVRSECGKYYCVMLSRHGVLDAEVRVYSETYYRVFWRSLLPGVPPRDSRLFGSLEEAVAFLRTAFLEGNWPAASLIPTYAYKRGPRPRPTHPESEVTVRGIDEDFFCAERGGGQ